MQPPGHSDVGHSGVAKAAVSVSAVHVGTAATRRRFQHERRSDGGGQNSGAETATMTQQCPQSVTRHNKTATKINTVPHPASRAYTPHIGHHHRQRKWYAQGTTTPNIPRAIFLLLLLPQPTDTTATCCHLLRLLVLLLRQMLQQHCSLSNNSNSDTGVLPFAPLSRAEHLLAALLLQLQQQHCSALATPLVFTPRTALRWPTGIAAAPQRYQHQQ